MPALRGHPEARRGFTLIELMVVVTIVAVAAAFIVPLARDEDRVRVMAAATVLASDIELAQVMTIAHPDDPVVVRFDADKNAYWLAYRDTPDDAMPHPDTGDLYEVVLGQGRAGSAAGVTMTIDKLPTNTLVFDESGGLIDFTETPLIQLSHGDQSITLAIAPMTGTVSETE